VSERPGKIDKERRAAIIAEAALIGDREASAKHGVATRTLRRWRQDAKSDGQLAEQIRDKRAEVFKGWSERVVEARDAALARALELVKKSTELRDVVGCLKILHDAILAEDLLKHGRQPDDGDGLGGEARQGSPIHRAAERVAHSGTA